MIIYTARFSKKKAIAIVLTIAIIVAGVILAMPNRDITAEETAHKVSGIKSAEDITKYIESLGYTVEGQLRQCTEVVIPNDFDLVYEEYNDIQKESGFDLSKHKGKKVTLYTYVITNYPDCNEEVLCDLLVHKSNIIGGNIYTLSLDGFMHGLKALEG